MADVLAAQIEEAQEELFDIDELTEALSSVALIDESRHEELVERVIECQTRLEAISTRLDENPQSPLLTQLLTTVTELRTENAKILAELENLKSLYSAPRPSVSEPPTIVLEVPPTPSERTESDAPSAEPSIDEPVPVEVPMPETPRKKRRVNLL